MKRKPRARKSTRDSARIRITDVALCLNERVGSPTRIQALLAATKSDPKMMEWFEFLALDDRDEFEANSNPTPADAAYVRQLNIELSQSILMGINLSAESAGQILQGQVAAVTCYVPSETRTAPSREICCEILPSENITDFFVRIDPTSTLPKLLNITVIRDFPPAPAMWTGNPSWSSEDHQAKKAMSSDTVETVTLAERHQPDYSTMTVGLCHTTDSDDTRLQVKFLAGTELEISCPAREGRAVELVLVEVTHPALQGGRVTHLYPLALTTIEKNKHSDTGPSFVEHLKLPLPRDARLDDPDSKVNICVRAAGPRDLCRFTSEQISMYLGQAESLTAFPLTRNEQGYVFRVAANEREQLLVGGATWAFRAVTTR